MTKELEHELGLVISALFAQSITNEEFQTWLCSKISENDNLPSFFFELIDFEEPLAKIYNVIGKVPSSSLSEQEELALDGIAYLRGITPYERPDKKKSLKAVNDYPSVIERFQNALPFIELQT